MQQITKTLQVLLIEDSLTDAILLERVFTKVAKTRFEIKRVESLQQGLDCLATTEFDVVLLDLSLPDSRGLNSLAEIQQVTKEVPIVVLTGTDSDDMAIAALREGAQDYLVKSHSLHTDVFGLLVKRAIAYSIERKHISRQLIHSEALYRGVIEDQTDFICRFSADGSIFFANQAFVRNLGENLADISQKNFFLLIASEDIASVSPLISSLNQSHPQVQLEFRTHCQQELAWQQWTIRAIFHDDELVEYQGVGQDISEIKAAESEKIKLIASLHDSREQFRIVTNSAPVMIWMSDARGKAIFINKYWLDFTGKTLEQAMLADWLTNIHQNDLAKCRLAYQDALQNREEFSLEYRLLDRQGEYRWIFHRGVPRFNEQGKFAGFVYSGIDISQRKNAETKLAQQAARNYILAEITQSIHESLELEVIIRTATKKIHDFLRVETAFIAKLESTSQFSLLFQENSPQANSCAISPVLTTQFLQQQDRLELLQTGRTLIFNPTQVANSTLGESPSSGFTSFSPNESAVKCTAVLMPIVVEKKLWGVLAVEECAQPRIWQKDEIQLLEQITWQLAIAIKQAELYHTIEQANQQLKELAVIDSLTGIANRRKFDEYMAAEWKRLAREQGTLCLIMCDIDYFKLYNDTYGHQQGDRCLRKVAQAIRKAVKRPADLTARYGGEEIVVVLPNTSIAGAKKLAQNICHQIKALQIPHINSQVDMYVTLSLGVAGCVPSAGSSVTELIAQADSNLYQAKKQGRNRVISSNTQQVHSL